MIHQIHADDGIPGTESQESRDDWDNWLWENFINNDENCPSGIRNPIQISYISTLLPSMEEFVRSAVQGILIASPLAFMELTISTRNWIMAIYATLDIRYYVMWTWHNGNTRMETWCNMKCCNCNYYWF